MYQEEYKRWMTADLEDADLMPELAKIEGNDDEIKERFAVALKFGTAGLRGVLGAGTNRMNIYVVRQATQGLANWVKTQGGTQTCPETDGCRCSTARCVPPDRSSRPDRVRAGGAWRQETAACPQWYSPAGSRRASARCCARPGSRRCRQR